MSAFDYMLQKKSDLRPVMLLVLGLFCANHVSATHNRAGEIRLRQVGPCNSLTLEATIVTWTKASSISADRDTLFICWGDGVCEAVLRTNGGGGGVILGNDVKYNTYVGTHTYAGPSTYKISMTDPNRNGGILNVNWPSSDNVPFHIETTYTFQDPQFGGCNSTPVLNQPPIDIACVGEPFRHNPNAYDADNDSLSYKLIVPLQDLGTPVPNYVWPFLIEPGGNNLMQLDERTGNLIWASPQKAGEYNIAIIVVSWRNGVPIDTTIRDMQIMVKKCDNNPPEVATIDEICVVAGDSISFKVTGNDPDPGQKVQLTGLGGPLILSKSPAKFTVPTGFNFPIVEGLFTWRTACEHISKFPYTMVFKATDNYFDTTGLSDLKSVKIRVVGPPPLDVQAVAQAGEVKVTWEKPYSCEGADDDYFYAFSVWRREGSNPFPLDTCVPGLAGKGYTELIYATRDMDNGRYVFTDTNVERGRTYCYRVLAKFAKLSAAGYPYNLVESLPSEEICVQLPRDIPLITNASVVQTDPANGQIEVRWSKPVAADLDTVLNHGPYRYQVRVAPGFATGGLLEIPGASFTANQFWEANDTFFVHDNLNTTQQPYSYQIDFYVRGEAQPLGSTTVGSSVFLTFDGADNTADLHWEAHVPWNNYEHTIYRKNFQTGLFDSIATVATPQFTDTGLVNGVEYCYYVRTRGTYSIDGVVNPIYNLSQIACGVPIDTVPPCAPILTVENLCTDSVTGPAFPPFINTLLWTNPNLSCTGTDDVLRYNVWYGQRPGDPLELLGTVEGAANTQFEHSLQDGLAGCYAVTAIDSFGNESLKTNIVCTDNCPYYSLPNVFTPNGDTHNDLYTPFPGWRFVESIDLKVYNRWGNLVFETKDPEINWNGKNLSGKDLSEGTYFYVCKVFEQRVEGVVLSPNILKGYIELIHGK